MDKAYMQAIYISGNLNSQRMNTHTHTYTHEEWSNSLKNQIRVI